MLLRLKRHAPRCHRALPGMSGRLGTTQRSRYRAPRRSAAPSIQYHGVASRSIGLRAAGLAQYARGPEIRVGPTLVDRSAANEILSVSAIATFSRSSLSCCVPSLTRTCDRALRANMRKYVRLGENETS